MRTSVLMMLMLAALCSACASSGAYAPWAGTYMSRQPQGTATLVIHADGTSTLRDTDGTSYALDFFHIQPTQKSDILEGHLLLNGTPVLTPQNTPAGYSFISVPHSGYGILAGTKTFAFCTSRTYARTPACSAGTGSP